MKAKGQLAKAGSLTPSTTWGPELELRSSPTEPSHQPHLYTFFHAVNQGWQTVFSKDQMPAVFSKLCHHHAVQSRVCEEVL